MLNTFYDSYCILNKVYSSGAFLKQAMLNTPIEEKNRSAVTKICYGVLDRDIFLSDRIKKLCDKNPKSVVRTILKIAIYNLEFLKKAPYAVIDTSVELVKKLGKKGVSGFVNAVLRKYLNTNFPEPNDTLYGLSVKYDHPQFVVKKLTDFYGKERAISVMSASGEKNGVRFNVEVDGKEYLSTAGVKFTETPYENFFLTEKFLRNADYDKGVYTFQSLGSVAICYSLLSAVGKQSLNGELLDTCAAPGGKTVLLANSFGGVVSEELHEHRVGLIEAYVQRMGVKNVSVVNGDASIFNDAFKNRFTAVLCDVPCSGFGVLKSNPDIKLRRTEEDVKELSVLQKNILSNCAGYVKSGGIIVYSTCSVLQEENDGVVCEFLKSNGDFTLVEQNPAVPYLKTKYGVQFLPDECYGAGFFVSVLRKNKLSI